MDADIHSEAKFGADTVRPTDQHGIREVASLEIEHATKSADFHVGAGAGSTPHQRLDGVYKRVACVHRYTGLCVG